MKKYELTTDSITVMGVELFRIKSLISFADVQAGELGGYIEKEENLSQSGDCWIYDVACVFGNAIVGENARVHEKALVYGNAKIHGNANIWGYPKILGNARIYGNSKVYGYALVEGDASVYGNVKICEDSSVFGSSTIYGNAKICGSAHVCGDAVICGEALIYFDSNYTTIRGFGRTYRNTTFFRTRKENIEVVCGCFYGTIDQFRQQVKKTHGNTKTAKEYLMIADLMKYHFSEE